MFPRITAAMAEGATPHKATQARLVRGTGEKTTPGISKQAEKTSQPAGFVEHTQCCLFKKQITVVTLKSSIPKKPIPALPKL